MSNNNAPMQQLAAFAANRDKASRRVDELEAELRAAGQARAEARAALVEAERRGVRAAERTKLEQALTDAEARPSVLAARIEGARHALRDCEVEVARFVGENLRELVEIREAEGQVAVANLNTAAEALVAAYHERERIAREISGLASLAGRVRPGDVSRSRAEQLARAASDLLQAGGEKPPTLDRDPRQPSHGELVEAAS